METTVVESSGAIANAPVAVQVEVNDEVESPLILPEKELKYRDVQGQRLTLLKDAVIVHGENGVDKTTSLNDFVRSMNAAYSASNSSTEDVDFQMPQACRFFSIGRESLRVTNYYPSSVQTIKYSPRGGNTQTFRIIVPNIILSFKLTKDKTNDKTWRLRSDHVMYLCTNLDYSRFRPKHFDGPDNNNHIYSVPFCNMYPNGKVCYGNSTDMPGEFRNNNLSALDYFYQFLFISPFNDDLSIPGVEMSRSEWWRVLQNCANSNQPFPYERLYGYRAI